MRKINSEMAGMLIEILVKPGDAVTVGQNIAKIESMKMEIEVPSPLEGTVEEVVAEAGEFVNEGDTLIVLA